MNTDTISIDDFFRVVLVAGRIDAAEAVPDSKKLLKLTVHIGSEDRQIIAGIAPHAEPEGLIGRGCVIVANLEPKVLAGLESQGMLLAGVAEDGSFDLVHCPGVSPGTRVR
ncbi:MAG: methionine--tRNA ligase [Candidatus Kaiserbacteria bacterium]|nr:methionine--tRNA ligase [Candidatus Kaiserbacteria bacterium]